jgi:hypothetical protein
MIVSLGVGAGNISKTVRPIQTNCATKNFLPRQAKRGFAVYVFRRMFCCLLEWFIGGDQLTATGWHAA